MSDSLTNSLFGERKIVHPLPAPPPAPPAPEAQEPEDYPHFTDEEWTQVVRLGQDTRIYRAEDLA